MCLIAGAGVYLSYGKLQQYGELTHATVEDRLSRFESISGTGSGGRDTIYYLRLAIPTSDGELMVKEQKVDASYWEQIEIGESAALVWDERDPETILIGEDVQAWADGRISEHEFWSARNQLLYVVAGVGVVLIVVGIIL